MLFADESFCSGMVPGLLLLLVCCGLAARKVQSIASGSPEVKSAAAGVAVRLLGRLFK